MIKTTIEIMMYGDYDIPYTKYIMISNIKFDTKKLKNDFLIENNISTENYSSTKLANVTEKFVEYLKNKGFSILKTNSIIFSD